MIGFLQGDVLFSDGQETIIHTPSGIGYQVMMTQVLPEGSQCAVFISHVIKEDSQTLFGFSTFKEKKLFELLLSVKGVGPKSAFSLVTAIGVNGVVNAIQMEDKKTLQKAPGIGGKAAAQILLDLSEKIKLIAMYSDNYTIKVDGASLESKPLSIERVELPQEELPFNARGPIFDEALMACKELGFKEDQIIPLAEKIMQKHNLQKSDQLVHLVLREVNV